MTQQRPLRVGLLWHSLRSDNLGVGALAVSNLNLVAAAASGLDVSYRVIGFGGPLHYPPPGLAVEEHLIRSFSELVPGSTLWRAIAECDLVLDIGAGDSWADIYTRKRFIWQWFTKEMAMLQRSTLVLSPQTIGPFRHAVSKLIARSVMRRARKVFTRDAELLAFMAEMGVADGATETVDVAFRLPFVRSPRPSGGRIRFGLNVSGLLYAGGYSGQSQFGPRDVYRTMVDGIVTRLLERGDVDVTLVPHVVPNDGQVEDDVAVSHAIAARFAGVTVAPLFTSPGEAKSFISGLDVLAGSRMHATIAAVSSGVAVVPLAYSRKFRGVFNSIGYPLIGDCTTQTAPDLVDLTLSAVDRRGELAAAAAAGAAIADKRIQIYQDYLAELLAELAAKRPA